MYDCEVSNKGKTEGRISQKLLLDSSLEKCITYMKVDK